MARSCYIFILIKSWKSLELVSSHQHSAKTMLKMFVIQHTSIWTNFILIVLRIQKKYAWVYLLFFNKAYDEVTYFEICQFPKKTKISISWEQNIIFCSNERNNYLHIKGYFTTKNSFIAEVTFKKTPLKDLSLNKNKTVVSNFQSLDFKSRGPMVDSTFYPSEVDKNE